MKLTILGAPLPKQGDRSYISKGKDGKAFISHYTPLEVAKESRNIRAQIVSLLPEGFQPFKEPLTVRNLKFVFPMLKTHNKRAQEFMNSGGYVVKDTKPDLDNLLKNLWDACQGIVFVKDQQIYEYTGYCGKYYGATPKIEFEIEPITEWRINLGEYNPEIVPDGAGDSNRRPHSENLFME